ncbi:MAG: class I SAM-dependent methyltransferase [Sphaerochaetaceae bacterium]|nr:class I SAM-dependent methyltransferase [Sphaerochaetaceae bacterium]
MAIVNNTKFYEEAVIKYGVSPRGVHWNSKQTQEKRFEILLEFIKKDISNSSIIDAGCGFGDLIKYFSSNNLIPNKYLGLDAEYFYIEIASNIYPNTNFMQLDILEDELPMADYYICSGALNTLEFQEIQVFINKCFNASKKGFIFNFLKGKTFNGIKKEKLLEFCNKINTNNKIKENYLKNDFSVFMIKENS